MRLLLALALLLGACGGPSATRPLGAIDAYVKAIESGDYDRAYELMSDRYRKEHTREEFVRLLRESPRDVKETARRLKSGDRQVAVRATYVYDDLRDELVLVEEDGAWRIDVNPLDYYPQDTPKNTLRSFVRAVELKRYDVLVRFVPKAYGMNEDKIRMEFEGERAQEISDLLTKLRAAGDGPIDVQGDAAVLPYADHAKILFVREDGLWKIEDFQ
jgi:hypothetical protein